MSSPFRLESLEDLEKQYQQNQASYESLFLASKNWDNDPTELESCLNDLLNYQKTVGKVYSDVLAIEKLVHVLASTEEGENNLLNGEETHSSQARHEVLSDEIKSVQQRFIQIAKRIVELKEQLALKMPGLIANYEELKQKEAEIESIKASANTLKVYEGMSVEQAKQELYEQQLQITELSKALMHKKDTVENNQLIVEDLEEEVEQLKEEAQQLRVKAIEASNAKMTRDKTVEETYAYYDRSVEEIESIFGIKKVEVDAAHQIRITVIDSLAKDTTLHIEMNNGQLQDAHLVGVNHSIPDAILKRAKKVYTRNRNLSFLVIEVLAQLKQRHGQQAESANTPESMEVE